MVDTTRTCSIDGCARPAHARGWCGTHYARWQRLGTVELRPVSLAERFWKFVDRSGPCWLWTGSTRDGGYGQFNFANNWPVGAHRVAYWLTEGAVAEEMTLDHLCRNPRCVNPRHLEPVTREENSRREGEDARRERCVNGHDFTPENVYTTSRGHRRCRTCTLASNQRSRERRAA